MSVTNA